MDKVRGVPGAAIVALSMSGAAAEAKMPGEGRTVHDITPADITGNSLDQDIVQFGLEMLGYTVKPPLEAD